MKKPPSRTEICQIFIGAIRVQLLSCGMEVVYPYMME